MRKLFESTLLNFPFSVCGLAVGGLRFEIRWGLMEALVSAHFASGDGCCAGRGCPSRHRCPRRRGHLAEGAGMPTEALGCRDSIIES